MSLKPGNHLVFCMLIYAMISNSASATFFPFKVHRVPTSDMNGTCLSLPGMKMDIYGRSVKLYHIATGNVHF